MVTTPTVLVLGAGASCPYGFPTAKQLRNDICEAFAGQKTPAIRLLGDNAAPAKKFLEFKEAFWKSGTSSVDAFLEGRPEFLDVGKLAIAYCLIAYENEKNLYDPPEPDKDWYLDLSERLNSSFDEFENNKLSIITFNYDRSLEHYLFTSLLNWHGRSVDDCIEKFEKLPIIHVYGQLGKIPYPQRGCRQYLPLSGDVKSEPGMVVAASQGITLLHEKESELQEVHNLLTAAHRICFLGFSYHPLNLSRLVIDTRAGSKLIFGTARGMIGRELVDVQGRVRKTLGSAISLADADNLKLLRQNLILG